MPTAKLTWYLLPVIDRVFIASQHLLLQTITHHLMDKAAFCLFQLGKAVFMWE
jgi:hypothetical protein